LIEKGVNAISNLQREKKTKLVIEQYDSDNDEENGNGVELDFLEIIFKNNSLLKFSYN
jgi:hypothetical protein